MTNLFVVGITAAVVGFSAVLVTLPHWFSRSLHRHRLWRLHDELVCDMLEDLLPKGHPDVQRLRRTILRSVEKESGNRALDLWIFHWARRPMSPDTQREIELHSAKNQVDGLNLRQRELLQSYRQRFTVLLAGSILLSSWMGLLTIIRYVPAAVTESKSQFAIQRPPKDELTFFKTRLVTREATDKAVDESNLGRRARKEVQMDRHLALSNG